MRRISLIVVHCSATPPSADIGAEEIRALHAGPKDTFVTWNGKLVACKGWDDIGYHFVVRRDGRVEVGRELDIRGAHAFGYNDLSIGICLIGGIHESPLGYRQDGAKPDCNFTRDQWYALETLVTDLKGTWPGATVLGHRDLAGVTKACPSCDIPAWWSEQ